MSKDKPDKNDFKVTYSKNLREEKIRMASKSIPVSKTLDSIASLPRDNHENGSANYQEDENSIEFKRSGVLLLAKSDAEGVNGEQLFPGTLSLTRKSAWQTSVIEWIPQELGAKDGSEAAQYGTSFSDREWTMINDQMIKRNVRPIEFELIELRSFRLSDDGNRMIMIQRDGTRHPPLIFLDEGPEELIRAMQR